MEKVNQVWKLGGYTLVGLGVVFLAASIFLDGALNLALPLVFFMLAVVFITLGFSLSEKWLWAVWLFIPGTLLFAFAVIFLLNVLTGDWQAWAYAWLLLVAGLGAGLALAGWYGQLRQEFLMAGVALIVLGVTFFAVFGVIAGGLVIKVAAPLLLVAGGVAITRLRPETVLPVRLLRRWFPALLEPESAPDAAASLPAGGGTAAGAAAGAAAGLVEPVSARELEVLRLIDAGLSNIQIAERLTLAPSTIKTHINNLYGKLNVQTRVQALNRAREIGLLE
jgi:DNA-binding CsgD family transcriptional regulator